VTLHVFVLRLAEDADGPCAARTPSPGSHPAVRREDTSSA